LSEQCKNLVLVYFQIDSFNGLKPIIISFLQTLNPQIIPIESLASNFCCNALVVFYL
jgi:hypothetical protein